VNPSINAALCLAALFPASIGLARDNTIRVDVVVDVTPAGEKVPLPSAAQPVSYFPYTAGFTVAGEIPPGAEEPPPTAAVQHLLARALADEGYRVATKASPPSVFLAFWWGYKSGDHAAMEELVLGSEYDDNAVVNQPSLRLQAALSVMDEPRYYLIVSAMDLGDLRRGKYTVLWTARASTELEGSHFDEVLPAMITAAAPRFGRKTNGPEFTEATITPMGHAEFRPVTENYVSATRAPRPIQEIPLFVQVLRNGPIHAQ